MTRRGLAVAGVVLTAAALLASCSTPGPGTATQPSKSSLATTPAPTPRETPAQAQTPAPSTSPTGRASAAAMTAADVYSFNRDLVLSVLARHGSARALDTLGRLARNEAGVSGVCHAIAHDLGHAALELAGGRVGDALTDRDDVCGGGFTHGVIEHALAESADPGADMLNVCAPQQDGSCWHGVGHGLMFASGMDTVRALAGCDRAPRPQTWQRAMQKALQQAMPHMETPPAALPRVPPSRVTRLQRAKHAAASALPMTPRAGSTRPWCGSPFTRMTSPAVSSGAAGREPASRPPSVRAGSAVEP